MDFLSWRFLFLLFLASVNCKFFCKLSHSSTECREEININKYNVVQNYRWKVEKSVGKIKVRSQAKHADWQKGWGEVWGLTPRPRGSWRMWRTSLIVKRRKVVVSPNIIPRTAEATGLSEMSVKRIHKEYLAQDCKFLTPVKWYCNSISRIRVYPDSFDRAAVKRIVHGLYYRREYTTISGVTVLEKANHELAFRCGRFCMWRLLNEVGFLLQTKRQSSLRFRTTTHNSTPT